ncbi:ATP-binding protein [Paracoccus aestuarii]|nr:ATP-binding protein [Paracoccus aestuarii]
MHDQLYLDPGARDLSLRDYVAGLAADLAQALNVRVSTHDRLDEGHRVSPGQAAAIGQILAELIGNAAKHGHPGHHPSMELTLEQQGRQLRLSLVDDGPGQPEGFDPDHSSGLGMQICLIYARQMDGRLDHGAGPEGGARFDVTLRLDDGIAA